MYKTKRLLRMIAVIILMLICMVMVTVQRTEIVQAAAVDTDDPEDVLDRDADYLDETLNSSAKISLLSNTSNDSELTIKAYGIDVSKHQGSINWTKVKAAGVSFAIIRVGYRGYSGGTLVQDEYAIANIEGALAAGIEVGVYFFSTALNEEEAIEEAQFVLDIIEDYDITYPVVYDCEGYENSSYRNYGTSSAVRTANAVAYLNYVEAAGYQGMMYGSSSHLKNDNSWKTSTLEQYYDIWVAQYPYYTYTSSSNYTLYPSFSAIGSKTTTYTGSYRIWQCSSQGSINGISGYVDLDIEYETEIDDTSDVTNGWYTDSDGNKYYYVNGVKKTGLCTISGKKYYFTQSGIMYTGWLTLNDGVSENATYYFTSDGYALTNGLNTISGSKYYFNTSGRLHYGWRTINSAKYYFDSDTGAMKTGWVTVSGYKYYLNSNGKMQVGWKTLNGKRYYFNASGRLHYGWRTINGEKYYFDTSTGVLKKGLVSINGKKYYFNTSGRLHYGWRTINGEKYYFDKSTGAMKTSCWVTISGKKYYFNPSGRLHYGWRTIDGYKYYCDPKTGVMQTGWVTINGKKYYFYSNGRLKTS